MTVTSQRHLSPIPQAIRSQRSFPSLDTNHSIPTSHLFQQTTRTNAKSTCSPQFHSFISFPFHLASPEQGHRKPTSFPPCSLISILIFLQDVTCCIISVVLGHRGSVKVGEQSHGLPM